jgi:hypothetical protein
MGERGGCTICTYWNCFYLQTKTVHIYREEGRAKFSKPMKKHIGAAIRAKTKTLNKRTANKKE